MVREIGVFNFIQCLLKVEYQYNAVIYRQQWVDHFHKINDEKYPSAIDKILNKRDAQLLDVPGSDGLNCCENGIGYINEAMM